MLCAFGHRVAMCSDMFGVVGSSLKIVKFEPTTPNMSQHVATGWPNAHNMLRPTMLRYVELACCDRLAGALVLVYLTTRVVQPIGWKKKLKHVQHVLGTFLWSCADIAARHVPNSKHVASNMANFRCSH